MGNTSTNNNVIIINDDGFMMKKGHETLSYQNNEFKLDVDGIKMSLNKNEFKMKEGAKKLTVNQDLKQLSIFDKGERLDINNKGVFFNDIPLEIRTPHSQLIFIQGQSVEFECQDRVRVHQNQIYCGNQLYYEFVNKQFNKKYE